MKGKGPSTFEQAVVPNSFSFYVDKELDKFVDYLHNKTLKIGFFGAQSDLLFA